MGDPAERTLKQYEPVVEAVNALEPTMQALSDDDFPKKTAEFRERLENGEPLDDLLPEAFALVREASVRTIGLRHYDVQLIGGTVLHEGRIAEMKTGEGKTLVATLPVYLNALTRRGVHIVTPNDYLSKVGLQQMGPVYHLLGLSGSVIQNTGGNPDTGSYIYDLDYVSDDDRYQNLRDITRREAYTADITYGTNNEFGFDYLRDNMVHDIRQMAQKSLQYAIIDEVDNILIDEARTPLIISGPADAPSDYYKTFTQIVRRFKPSSPESVDDDELEPDGDYVVELKDRTVYLTEEGVSKVERALGVDELYHPDNSEMIPYLDNCLRAKAMYNNDKEYVVQGGQVVIVDEITGRMMPGRRFSEGLHQAIEAKEGVEIRRENVTMATITFQNFFRMYEKLGGMTGTAVTEAEEFEKIYNLDVAVIPTHRPIARMDQQDFVYVTEDAKFRAVVNEIQERQQKGQPVLVGTASIDTSQRLAKYFERAKIKHEILNAKQHEREATIIAQAGRPGSVTIATNMAGRGVDILLGGNPEGIAREKFRKEGRDVTEVPLAEWNAAVKEASEFTKTEREKVLALGGLYVLGTERHEARRIDNQLRGRSGRQGDPGESRFFVSLEDDIMKRFGGDRVKNVMNWANLEEDIPIESSVITGTISQAQIRMEGHNFDIRKKVLEYDDVVNKQREVIYKQRREWMELSDEERRETYRRILQEMAQDVLDDYLDEEIPEDELDFEGLYRQLLVIFPVPQDITPDTLREMEANEEDIDTVILTALDAAYDYKIEAMTDDVMQQAERHVMLWAVDQLWQRHLTDLDILREGIGLESMRQRNPVVEYKLQGFEMWQKLQDTIRDRAGRDIFRVRVNMPKPEPKKNLRMIHGNSAGAGKAEPKTVRKSAKKKIGRNDPCWCGSGKKYKHCHYKEDRQAEMA
ncbi:MAG: preprotein translocase subunit SecA [Chloroflexota bacterium]